MDSTSVLNMLSLMQDSQAGFEDNRLPLPATKLPSEAQVLSRFQHYMQQMGKNESANAEVGQLSQYGPVNRQLTLWISSNEINFKTVKDKAASLGVSINDLLIAATNTAFHTVLLPGGKTNLKFSLPVSLWPPGTNPYTFQPACKVAHIGVTFPGSKSTKENAASAFLQTSLVKEPYIVGAYKLVTETLTLVFTVNAFRKMANWQVRTSACTLANQVAGSEPWVIHGSEVDWVSQVGMMSYGVNISMTTVDKATKLTILADMGVFKQGKATLEKLGQTIV